jgi:hypothetical protein
VLNKIEIVIVCIFHRVINDKNIAMHLMTLSYYSFLSIYGFLLIMLSILIDFRYSMIVGCLGFLSIFYPFVIHNGAVGPRLTSFGNVNIASNDTIKAMQSIAERSETPEGGCD